MKYVSACRASSALLLLGAVEGCDAQVDPNYQGEPLATLKGRVTALAGAPSAAEVGVLWLADAEGSCTGPERMCSGSSTGTTGSSPANTPCTAACGAMPECEAEAIDQWQGCLNACGSDIEVSIQVEHRACFSGGVGQKAPVVGDFPAQFSLDVLSPPPAEALLRSDTEERVALGYFVALEPNEGPLILDTESREVPSWLLGGSETHILVYAADPIGADSTWGIYLGGAYAVGYHLIRVIFGNRCGLPQPRRDDDADIEGISVDITTDASSVELPPVEPEMELEAEPDYRGVPLVCGNGVCEENENCDICSDCTACDGSSPGMSTGQSNLEGVYHCEATPGSLAPIPSDGDAVIELLIAPVERIDWPAL